MKNKKIIYILITFLLVLAILTGVTFAIFTAVSNNTISNIKPGGNDGEIIINSQYELIINSVSSEYNSDSLVSSTRSRLKLGKDIKLDKNIIIDKDISLSLGGFTLDNSGYNITIRHNYVGLVTVRLASGKLLGTGKLILDTPRSILDTDIAEESITILQFDKNRVITEAKEYLQKVIKPYYVADISLPLFYRFYTEIAYNYQFLDETSSATSTVIDNVGHIDWNVITDSAVVNLRVSIADDSTQSDYKIILVKSNEKKLELAKTELEKEILKYKDVNNNRYMVKNNVALPKRYDYIGVDFSYSVSDETVANIYNNNILSVTKSGYFLLTATLSVGSVSQNVELSFVCQLNSPDEIASKFVKDYFQWIFVYNNNVVEITPFLEGQRSDLLPSKTDWSTMLISGVSYSFVDSVTSNQQEITDIYELKEETVDGEPRLALEVKKYPSITDDIYLKIIMDIGGTEITRYVQIYYINGDSSGGGGAGGDTYNYIYEEIGMMLPSKTYLTFIMPSTIKNVSIEYFIKVNGTEYLYQTPDGILILNKITGSTEFTIDLTKIPTNDTVLEICYKFGTSTEIYARTSRLTIEGIIRESLFLDSNLRNALLGYKVNGVAIFNGQIEAEDGTITYDGVISTLRAMANIDSVDLSNKQITNLEGIQFFRNIRKLILDGNVLDSGTVANSLSKLAETNLEHLSLKNSGLKADSLNELGKLYALIELNLDDNNLTSIINLPSFGNLTTLTVANNLLESIDILINFPSLSLLDVQNNKIKSFRKLYEISDLDKVFIFDNTVDSNFGTTGDCNKSIIALLAKKGVKVFQEVPKDDFTNYFKYEDISSDDKIAIGVIEGIKIYQGSITSLQLPTKMFVSANKSYDLVWDLTALGTITQDSTSVLGIRNIIFPAIPKGEIKIIFVSVTIGTATYKRHFEVIGL